MKRIAIVGGGIAGVSAAYQIALEQRAGAAVELVLFEASGRLGGTVETVCRDGFVIECGPDSWVTEKPWARTLAIELGLEPEIIYSQDKNRKTYLAEASGLHAMPDGMRMMVPVEWAGVLASPLFSKQAKLDYQREPELAEQLKATALDASEPPRDESVREFTARHFGVEVADTIAAPLLAGIFGGDVRTLSARAVLPAYVALEREHGSLILGLQQRRRREPVRAPIFSTLRNGLGELIDGMQSYLSASNVASGAAVLAVERKGHRWRVRCDRAGGAAALTEEEFDAILIATPAKTTARILDAIDRGIGELLPQRSSSAIVVALAYSAQKARCMNIPAGFGFLVPQRGQSTTDAPQSDDTLESAAHGALLACTFVDQKFPDRVPPGSVLLRAVFGGAGAAALMGQDDAALEELARTALGKFLAVLPEPTISLVRRWPDSLPLYQVGHLDRIRELESRVARLPQIRLIGNAYRGVGLPDLIRDGRTAAGEMVAALAPAAR